MDNNTAAACRVNLTLPANSRTSLCLEIKTAIRRGLLGAFPVDLPFLVSITDPNDANNVADSKFQVLGIRPVAGVYDNNTEAGGYFFTRSPIQTGDNLSVRFDAIDLQNRANTPTPYRISGLQYVSGEFARPTSRPPVFSVPLARLEIRATRTVSRLVLCRPRPRSTSPTSL